MVVTGDPVYQTGPCPCAHAMLCVPFGRCAADVSHPELRGADLDLRAKGPGVGAGSRGEIGYFVRAVTGTVQCTFGSAHVFYFNFLCGPFEHVFLF